jgi:hypothetical protein
MVRVETAPIHLDSPNLDLRKDARYRMLCLGKVCRVLYVGNDGRPQIDASEHVCPHTPGLLGCSLSFDPQCLTFVKYGGPFEMPYWNT